MFPRLRTRPFGARVGAIGLAIGVIALVGIAAPIAPAVAVTAATGQDSGVSNLVGEPLTVTNNSRQTLQVPVLSGLSPNHIRGSISAPESRLGGGVFGGTVVVTVGGQEVYRGEAKAARFDTELTKPQVIDQNMAVVIQYIVPELRSNFCSNNFQQLNLVVDQVTFTGKQTAPKTVGEFLQPGVSVVNVVIPRDPNGDQVSAGLAAVGASVFKLGPATQVKITQGTPDARLVELPGVRIIRIEHGLGPATTVVSAERGTPVLTITGRSSTLNAAATKLGSPETPFVEASSGETSTKPVRQPTKSNQTFAEIGVSNSELSGWGSQAIDFVANQSQFGGSVRDVRVQLAGVRSQIPAGARANLNVYWNGQLVEALDLRTSPRIAIEVEVPNPLLTELNQVRVELATLPADGSCQGTTAPNPVTVDLDLQQSQVRTSRGQTIAPGFARFPQAFNGSLPVAFAKGSPSPASIEAASHLVASLQGVNVPQLLVEVVPFDQAASGADSALVVDADESVSARLGAPMLLNQSREIRTSEHSITTRGAIPFSALEAFSSGTRNMLMLGGWAPAGSPASEVQGTSLVLAEYVNAPPAVHPNGWASLTGDIVLVEPGSTPQILNSNAMVPQPPVIRADGWVLVWMVGAILVFVGLGTWRYVYVTRREK